MAQKTLTRESGKLISRDWLIATGQAVVLAVATSIAGQIETLGLNIDWKEVLAVAVLSFLYHIGRKATGSGKEITVKEIKKDA